MASASALRAAKLLRAVELDGGSWAYYDDGTRRWYVVDTDDLESYCTYLDSENKAIASDAYSHWCAGTQAEEMPEGWEPSPVEQRETRY